MRQVRLVVVDHSVFIREALVRLLADEPRIAVVGLAASGTELLANLTKWRPDVITLELSMPGMNGVETLDQIMATRPTPVVVFSTHSAKDAPLAIEALNRGAVDFIDKQAYSLVDFQALREVVVKTVLEVAAAGLPKRPASPVRRRPDKRGHRAWASRRRESAVDSGRFDIIAVGASTGGPPAIERILRDLGTEVPVPVCIVQHMPVGFTESFSARLHEQLPLDVREASDGESLCPHMVRIAPAGRHLMVSKQRGRVITVLSDEPSDQPHRPSVDVFFASAADALGSRVLALLLTGMGRDGSRGMANLAAVGAHTIVQDEESSAVYGMPRAAVELEAALEVLPLTAIGPRLRGLTTNSTDGEGAVPSEQ